VIISRTPFRVSFFGGGTDYPEWYREHGGAVLATTINLVSSHIRPEHHTAARNKLAELSSAD